MKKLLIQIKIIIAFQIIFLIPLGIINAQNCDNGNGQNPISITRDANQQPVLLKDANGCYVEVSYNWPYSVTSVSGPTGTSDTSSFFNGTPYGLDVIVQSPVTVTSIVQVGNWNWSSFSYTDPQNHTWTWPASGTWAPINFIQPSVLCSYLPPPFAGPFNSRGWINNIPIPPTKQLQFKVYLNMGTSTNFKVWFRVLTGNALLGNHPVFPYTRECIEKWWVCNLTGVYNTILPSTYKLCPDCPADNTCSDNLCLGEWTKMWLCDAAGNHVTFPSGYTFKFYKTLFPSGTCPAVGSSAYQIETTVLPSPSTVWWPTNTFTLPGSYCYYATINDGCQTYVTPIKQMKVCPNGNFGSLTPSPLKPISGSNLESYEGKYHACSQWTTTSGDKTISFPDPGGCSYEVIWYKSADCGTTWDVIPTNPNKKYEINVNDIFENFTYSGPLCNTCFGFKAVITYHCCNSTPNSVPLTTFIVIDSKKFADQEKLWVSDIYPADPYDNCGSPCPILCDRYHPVLCWNGATRLKYEGPCGTVEKWFKWNDAISDWDPVSGTGNNSEYNTNGLKKTTKFRALVRNGVCTAEKDITVVVKPELTVSIAGNNIICPGQSTLLTATTSYDIPGYVVSYQWYFNGTTEDNMISGATGKTYDARQAGNYCVIVTDGSCLKSVQSTFINVCIPSLAIKGNLCICPNCPVNLGVGNNGCGTCGIYTWTGPNGFTATGPSITTFLPTGNTSGTYTVSSTCSGCTISASVTVKICQ